jgi:hypothetical protein
MAIPATVCPEPAIATSFAKYNHRLGVEIWRTPRSHSCLWNATTPAWLDEIKEVIGNHRILVDLCTRSIIGMQEKEIQDVWITKAASKTQHNLDDEHEAISGLGLVQ